MDTVPNYTEYLSHMRKPGSWGDVLTLTAISHLTLRPIRVVPDDPALPELFVTPPNFIAESTWGPEILLVHYGEIHYEATTVYPSVDSGAAFGCIGSVTGSLAPASSSGSGSVPGRASASSGSNNVPVGVSGYVPARVMQTAFQALGEERERDDVRHDADLLRDVQEQQVKSARVRVKIAGQIQSRMNPPDSGK